MSLPVWVWPFLILLLPAAAAVPADAGIPDPSLSECDTCLVMSPDGSFLFRLTLRDDANAPVANTQVFLDFAGTPGINLCAESDPDADRKVEGTTDAMGVVDFYVRGGGQSVQLVQAISQLTIFCLSRPRSPDLNGDLQINATDETLHTGLPLDTPVGDYDCDGDSDADDLVEIQSRLGNNCSSVQISQNTWGSVKAMYR
jgi:hypothetical protein